MQEMMSQCILFVDNIVLVGKLREKQNKSYKYKDEPYKCNIFAY